MPQLKLSRVEPLYVCLCVDPTVDRANPNERRRVTGGTSVWDIGACTELLRSVRGMDSLLEPAVGSIDLRGNAETEVLENLEAMPEDATADGRGNAEGPGIRDMPNEGRWRREGGLGSDEVEREDERDGGERPEGGSSVEAAR